jgi:hypothetical protein
MSKGISPYRDWLGIADPVHHYSLLGLPLFEGDPARVLAAGDVRRAIAKQHLAEAPDEAARLLAEIDAAEGCLLDPEKRSDYDACLRSAGGAAAYDPMFPPALTPVADPPGGLRKEPEAREPAPSPDSDSTSASIEIDLSEHGGLPPALRPSDFQAGPAGPAGLALSPGATLRAAPVPGAVPMALPVGPPPIPMALPVDMPLPPAGSAAAAAAPGGFPPTAIPMAQALPFEAVDFSGDAPMAAALPPAAPVASALYAPLAAPAAALSAPIDAPLATPLTPADFEAASGQGDADGHVSPAFGPAAPTRRATSGNLLMMVGVPAVLLVAAGLLLMYVTETGPFRQGPANVASRTAGRSGPTTPAESGSSGVAPKAGGSQPFEPKTDPGENPLRAPTSSTPTETPERPASVPAVTTEPLAPPADTPEPPSDPPPDAKLDRAVTDALMAARFYLAQRDLEAAKAQVENAKKLAESRHAAQVDRVTRLHHYVAEFWRAVAESIKSLDGGDQITIAGITVGVVETGPDFLIVRQSGRNRTYRVEDMPRGLAHGLAERWLNKDDAASPLILAAFHTVNPTSEAADARQLYERAAAGGLRSEVETLLPELEVRIPEDLAIPSSSPRRGTSGETQPPGEGRAKVPSAEELTAAQTVLQEKYKTGLESAKSAAERVALAETLDAASRAEGADAVTRYALYLAAREQLIAAGEAELACKLADGVAGSFAVEALDLKAEALADVARSAESPESNKKLAELGLSIADEALLAQKYPVALRILRTAQAAARKSRDTELIKEVSKRLTDAQLQAKSGA